MGRRQRSKRKRSQPYPRGKDWGAGRDLPSVTVTVIKTEAQLVQALEVFSLRQCCSECGRGVIVTPSGVGWAWHCLACGTVGIGVPTDFWS